MNHRLSAEIQRLYGLPGRALEAERSSLTLVSDEGRVRTMVLGVAAPADWSALSAVWRGVQGDLELPAPAIAVNGVDAYELWFSLAEPVPLAQAVSFLEGLRARCLAALKPQRVRMFPGTSGEKQAVPLIPAPQGESGNWSAFVAPDLAAVFGDDPLLDVPPGDDAQAELLSRLASIKSDAFQAALLALQPVALEIAHASAATSSVVAGAGFVGAARYGDPKLFLLDVMNDASVALALRIEAAKALMQR